MHQKVFLVDDEIAGVGTVNLDNRSFHLNFEVMAYVVGGSFVRDVRRMLERDFAASPPVDLDVYRKKGVAFRVAVRLSRLISAVL
jgi:cardiolipin synthase A/B